MSKKYDFDKAKRLIEENKEKIQRASMGMYEDWFWTAETLFEDGAWKVNIDKMSTVGGIDGSSWATPTLILNFIDEEGERAIPCYVGYSTRSQPPVPNLLGVLSGPVQDNMPPLTFEED